MPYADWPILYGTDLGDVPLVTYSYDNGSFPKIGRSSSDKVLQYAKNELLAAAAELPFEFGSGNNKYYWQDPAKEFCQTRGSHGDARPAGDPEEILQVVSGHRPAGGVCGRSSITDYAGNLELSFIDYSMDEKPKYDVEECKARDATYAAPMKVSVRLRNKETGEIKEQEIFMGDFPKMTEEFDRSVRRALDSLPERESKPVRRFSAKKIVCAGLAAALCIGGTAFAANAQSWFPAAVSEWRRRESRRYVQTADNAKLTDENEHYRLSVESVLFDESAGTGVISLHLANKKQDGVKRSRWRT